MAHASGAVSTTTRREAKRRPAPGVRRAGYVVAVLIQAALLFAINKWPGWDVVPFLDAEFPRVLGLVNASVVAGLVANLVYLVHDPRWLRSLGDAVTTTAGLVAMVWIWQVFPFDLGPGWALVFHTLLVVAIVGSIIGIAVGLGGFVRHVGRGAEG